MPRPRHAGIVVLTLGVTVGAGFVAEHRPVIEAALGLDGAPSRASTSIAAAPPAIAVADPSRMPDLSIEVAGPSALAGTGPLLAPPPTAAVIARLTDAAPAAFVLPEAMAPVLDGPAASEPLAPAAAPERHSRAEPAAPACGVALAATAAPAALIDLAVEAPCAAGAALTIRHEGLAVRVAADAAGRAALRLPALASPAAIRVEGPGGEAAEATVAVPDLAAYDRAVLLWQGSAAPQLHAREAGAAYGSPGDVRAEAPGTPEAAVAGTGGFLLRLGDPGLPAPMMAEVYTAPAGGRLREGAVVLTVEAQVSAATCGRDLRARTLQTGAGGALESRDVALTLPGCEAEGEWVVLDQMLDDLGVATL